MDVTQPENYYEMYVPPPWYRHWAFFMLVCFDVGLPKKEAYYRVVENYLKNFNLFKMKIVLGKTIFNIIFFLVFYWNLEKTQYINTIHIILLVCFCSYWSCISWIMTEFPNIVKITLKGLGLKGLHLLYSTWLSEKGDHNLSIAKNFQKVPLKVLTLFHLGSGMTLSPGQGSFLPALLFSHITWWKACHHQKIVPR